MTMSVGAYVKPGMILEQIKKTGKSSDILKVTAIGEFSFLAVDEKGEELQFKQSVLDGCYAIQIKAQCPHCEKEVTL
jgi:hypothetical protein